MLKAFISDDVNTLLMPIKPPDFPSDLILTLDSAFALVSLAKYSISY